jgi:hypothetical protein
MLRTCGIALLPCPGLAAGPSGRRRRDHTICEHEPVRPGHEGRRSVRRTRSNGRYCSVDTAAGDIADASTMLILGILLFVVLTFAAALIAGVGAPTATFVVVALMAALLLSRRRSGGSDIRS